MGDKKGCKGDITITVASGASVFGLSQTNLEFNEESCRFRAFPRQSITGVWELSASSPSLEFDATVSATAGLSAGVNLFTQTATITAVSLNDVEVGFGSAEIKLTPGGDFKYTPDEAGAITDMLNEKLLPDINTYLAERMPTSISPKDVSSPENIRAFLEKWFKN